MADMDVYTDGRFGRSNVPASQVFVLRRAEEKHPNKIALKISGSARPNVDSKARVTKNS